MEAQIPLSRRSRFTDQSIARAENVLKTSHLAVNHKKKFRKPIIIAQIQSPCLVDDTRVESLSVEHLEVAHKQNLLIKEPLNLAP